GSYQLIRIWTATDACGNTTTHQQLINVNDTTAPVFVGTMPAAVVKADCDTIPAAAVLTATDTCGTARVDFTETRLEGDCSAKYTLERVWTATDDCGNQSSFTQRVNVSCLAEVYNGISPNGDGKNDTFIIKGIDCYPNNNVSIFNRYGVILYEKQGYDNVTDVFEGISNGRTTINKGDKLPTGTYFYIIEYDNGGTKVKKSGYVYVAN
ncbi:MAG: gliding motility-associated C-terminal domain-containing protein, partial [Flavobacterium sp.]